MSAALKRVKEWLAGKMPDTLVRYEYERLRLGADLRAVVKLAEKAIVAAAKPKKAWLASGKALPMRRARRT